MSASVLVSLNPYILNRAMSLDSSETQRIVNAMQKSWDDGARFIDIFDFSPRSPIDDPAELAAAVKSTERTLIYKVIIPSWLLDLSRDDALSLCNHLLDSGERYHVFSESFSALDIALLWNRLHDDDAILLREDF